MSKHTWVYTSYLRQNKKCYWWYKVGPQVHYTSLCKESTSGMSIPTIHYVKLQYAHGTLSTLDCEGTAWVTAMGWHLKYGLFYILTIKMSQETNGYIVLSTDWILSERSKDIILLQGRFCFFLIKRHHHLIDRKILKYGWVMSQHSQRMTKKPRQTYRLIHDICTFYKMHVHNKATKVKFFSFV